MLSDMIAKPENCRYNKNVVTTFFMEKLFYLPISYPGHM